MRKHICWVLCFLPYLLEAQPYWAKHFDLRNGNDFGFNVITSEKEYFVLIAALCDSTEEIFCNGILKLDKDGNEIWRVIVNDTFSFNHTESIQVLKDTLLFHVEYQYHIDKYSVLKFDTKDGRYLGRFDYTYSPAKPDSDLSRDIAVGPDKTFTNIIFIDPNKNQYQGRLTAYNRNWKEEWAKVFPDPEWKHFNGLDMEATSDSGAVLAYTTKSSSGNWYAFIEKFDKNGNRTWRTIHPEKSKSGILIDIEVLPDQSYVCNWQLHTFSALDLYAQPNQIFKLSSAGELEWAKADFLNPREIKHIFTTHKGDIIACGIDYWGVFPDRRPADITVYILCTTSGGDFKWERRIDDYRKGAEWTEFNAGVELPNGDLLFAGTRSDTLYALSAPYVFDAWVVKTDSMGCLTPGCGFEQGITPVREPRPPVAFKAFMVFPVPTDGVCTLISVFGQPLPKGRYEALLYYPSGRLLERRPFDPQLPTDFDLKAGSSGSYLISVLREGEVVQVLKAVKA